MEVLLIRRAPGHTPALEVEEARALLDAIDISGQAGLRDRALVGLMSTASRASARRSPGCEFEAAAQQT